MYEGMRWPHLQSAQYTVDKNFYSQLHPACICTEMETELYYCLFLQGTMRTVSYPSVMAFDDVIGTSQHCLQRFTLVKNFLLTFD